MLINIYCKCCNKMDITRSYKRERNPVENANILSRGLFFFTCGLFRKGLRKKLGQEDIYKPMEKYNSTLLGNQLEKEWESQREKSSWRFLWCIMKVFGVQIIYLTLALIIVDVPLSIVKPLLQGKVVSYFSKDNTEVSNEMVRYYAALLIVATFTTSLFFNGFHFIFEQATLKLKIAICSLLYRKSLKLNSTIASKNANGQTITLITKDVDMLDYALFVISRAVQGVLNVIIMFYMIYVQIGIAAYSGTLILILLVPLQAYLGKMIGTYRRKTAQSTDSRIRITQEILTAIKIIKMYTWEPFFSRSVETLRQKEMQNLRYLTILKETAYVIGGFYAKFALYVCVITYVALGNYITAEQAFVVVGCFGTLSDVFTEFIPWSMHKIVESKTAIQRFTAFLNSEEVIRSCTNSIDEKQKPSISIKDVEVKCDNDIILNNISASMKSGLTILTGPTGSGKSTFLKLLLGDVNKSKGVVEVIGKMSYASQEPWLFPGTVRQNIIFNEAFDQDRYETIVRVCDLEKDFQDLFNGDNTYLTDHGLNLSGGQKTRINLARAVYRTADIYLLDDCLSSVDAHVAKYIFYECIKGFLKNKMCVLVTYQKYFLREADNIVVLSNKCLTFQGNYDKLKEFNEDCLESLIDNGIKNKKFETTGIKKTKDELHNVDESSKLLLDVNASSRDVYQEVTKDGSVSKKVYFQYFKSGGGIKMVLLVLAVAIAAQVASSWSEYFVSFWVDMEQELSGFRYNQTTNSTEFKKLEEAHGNLMIHYSLVILAAIFLGILRAAVIFMLTYKASINIHKIILKKIVNAGMIFFDNHLLGNIINRLSRDIGIIDEQISWTIFEMFLTSLTLFGALFVITSVNAIFLIPSAFFMGFLYTARRLYLPTSRNIRRLEGVTKSPVVGQFNATLDGLTTIRASQSESLLTKEFERHVDIYNSAVHMRISTYNAFGFFLNMICDFYVALIILTFLIFSTNTLAGKVGLAITQAFTLVGWLQWGMREWAEFENKMTSAERVLEYSKIGEEDKSGEKIKNWPNSGKIVFNNVSLCYSETDEKVLKDLNFTINAKHKIGIVGRTGAGKSSIISTLFRLYEFEGVITVDGIDTKSVDIELLRSTISIIPQDPVLFSGTVRSNLDPNNDCSDEQLWDALKEVELKNLIVSLQDEISEGGHNFSVGQKQLICLARAILRKNVILILDEATANIDSQTDTLIQETIKRNFGQCTVIAIAHKLSAIMDADRVLVMNTGQVVEYDDPQALLSNTNSAFYKMVRDAGLA